MNLHELVEKPTLNKLAEEIQELWWQTAVREEDLQIQHFDKLWDWEKKAKQHYSTFNLSLTTRVFNCRPEYKLTFQNFWNGEIISQSDQLPVQAQWCPVDNFWLDSRRYDYAV